MGRTKIKVGTDFSGIGAPEQALKNLGYDFEMVFACEIDKHASRSYQEIHPEPPNKFYIDITKRDHAEVEPLDLYVAGFPCQSFSMAGKRKGWATDENGQQVDKRGTLFFDVAKFIQINQPKVFILENVKGLISHEGGKTYQTITDILTNGGGTLNGQMSLDVFDDGLGYHVYAQVLNSKEHGVPQNRERIFIIGFKDFRPFSFPKKEPLKKKLKDILEAEVNEKYYLSEKAIQGFLKHKERHQEKGTGFQFEPKDPEGVSNCLRAKQPDCPTDNYIEVNSQRIEANNEVGVYANRIRRLTPLECWRLQDFPDEAFYKAQAVTSDSQLYKQAGNSITVRVIQKIIERIYEP